jgi:hypothetical protein
VAAWSQARAPSESRFVRFVPPAALAPVSGGRQLACGVARATRDQLGDFSTPPGPWAPPGRDELFTAAAPAAGPRRPYNVPAFTEPKMGRDDYVEVAKALYSVTGKLIGQRLSAASTPT